VGALEFIDLSLPPCAPVILMAKEEAALAMMMSPYVTLGIFLLLAARTPSANRSLIGFTA
jgi:hypothetical protein